MYEKTIVPLLLSVCLLCSCEDLLPAANSPENQPITFDVDTTANRNQRTPSNQPTSYDSDAPNRPSTTTTERLPSAPPRRTGPYALSEVDRPPLFSSGCRNDPRPSECSDRYLARYFNQNIRYPDLAFRQRLEGIQYVSFYLDRFGRVDDESISVISSTGPPCSSCATTARNAVRNMPNWQPAYLNNESVAVRLVLPIRFDLR